MTLAALRTRFAERDAEPAIIFGDDVHSYADLRGLWGDLATRLDEEGVIPGTVVALEGDFSPLAVALFLALAERECILVPLTPAVADVARLEEIAAVEVVVSLDGQEPRFRRTGRVGRHPHHVELRRRGHPGLVIFTSGSTGEPKGAVHDLAPLLERHANATRAYRAITFLLYDHIGGVNTMLRLLATGSCMVCVERRDPDVVLAAVERHGVELLPVSPTFLNLVLLGGAIERHDLSSLRVVSYGTEPMPASTLARVRERLPSVRLVQLYGLSEVGILPSRTRDSDSLWIELGGAGAEVRIVDGLLEIRADTVMLGYLNAPSPLTADGWLRTGDAVDVDGPWIRVRGRASDLINVGGEKVFPAEVESVLLEMDGVDDVSVRGVPNPIVGQMVCARVSVAPDCEPKTFRRAARAHCAARLEAFKIPAKFEFVQGAQHSPRFKRVRL